MKTTAKFVFLLSFFLLGTQMVYSQSLLDRVKQKANKKIEKRLEEKLDQQVDKQLDNIENSIDSLGGQKDTSGRKQSDEEKLQLRMQAMMSGLGMSGEPVPVEERYVFTERVQMLVESHDESKNKTSSGEFITHLNPDAQSMAYEVLSGDIGSSEQGLFIIDLKNKAIILLNDKEAEKTGIVYGMGTSFETVEPMDFDHTEEDALPENVISHPNVKKTGKTKTIAGYKCEQYTYVDDETESEFWMTDALTSSSTDFFSTLFKTSLYTHGMGWGYVMESVSKDKRTGDTHTMRVTEVDSNSRQSFNLSAYQITNLGSLNTSIDRKE